MMTEDYIAYRWLMSAATTVEELDEIETDLLKLPEIDVDRNNLASELATLREILASSRLAEGES